MELTQLRQSIPYKWKVQAFWPPKAKEKKQCLCVAYIDARQATDLLDTVVGPENWCNRYEEVKGRVFCEVGIRCGTSWVYKSDCGTESDMEAEKGEASDAFKRACVKWGIGRFLYDMPEMKVPAKAYKERYYPADNKGNILWTKEALTEFCDSQLPENKDFKEGLSEEQEKPKEKESAKGKVEGFPEMTKEQRERMGRIWKFVKATYPEADILPDDVSKAVYATLGNWPESTKDEEQFCSSFKIEKD